MKRKMLLAVMVVLGVQAIAVPAFAPLEIRELTITVVVSTKSPTAATLSETNGGKQTVVANDLVLEGSVDCQELEACANADLHEASFTANATLQLARRDRSARLQGRMTALVTVGDIEPAVGLRARVRGVSACELGQCRVDLQVEGTLLSPDNRRVGTAEFELSGVLAWSSEGLTWEDLDGTGILSFSTTWDPTNGGPWE